MTWYVGARKHGRKKHQDPECRALQATDVKKRDAEQVATLAECGHCCGSGTEYAHTVKTSLRNKLRADENE